MDLSNIKNLLFDLDGTLVDSRDTISASLEHALGQVGAQTGASIRVESVIGKPLLDIFQDHFELGAGRATRAVGIYREYYDSLAHQGTQVYQNVPEVLAKLKQA